MAEAFGIIGLAANIAQFVDYGIKIVSAGKEVYESAHGMTQEMKELDSIVGDIRSTSQDVLNNTPSIKISEDELAIQRLAKECETLARELRSVLDKLTIREDARLRTLESGRVAIQGLLKRREVQNLKNRLQDLDRRLRNRLSKALLKLVAPILYPLRSEFRRRAGITVFLNPTCWGTRMLHQPRLAMATGNLYLII